MKPLPKKSTGTAVNMDGVISLEKVFIKLGAGDTECKTIWHHAKLTLYCHR